MICTSCYVYYYTLKAIKHCIAFYSLDTDTVSSVAFLYKGAVFLLTLDRTMPKWMQAPKLMAQNHSLLIYCIHDYCTLTHWDRM